MEIQKITKYTASYASHIYAYSWKTAYQGIVPSNFLDKLSVEHWTPFLRDSLYTGYLLKVHDEFVATTSISSARDETMGDWGEIISIYVLPQHFNKGYGKKLFFYAVEQLHSKGHKKIYVWVLKNNRRARAFYERNGFFPNGDETTINIGGKELIEVRYINSNN